MGINGNLHQPENVKMCGSSWNCKNQRFFQMYDFILLRFLVCFFHVTCHLRSCVCIRILYEWVWAMMWVCKS